MNVRHIKQNELEETVVIKSDSYNSFLELINKCRKLPAGITRLNIDLCKISFIKPYHVVILACIIENFEISSRRIKIAIVNPRRNVHKYLTNIRFYEYWNPGFDRKIHTQVKIDTTLCLWQISREMISQYVDYARDYYQKHYFKGKDLYCLYVNLSETFNNIFDHAESPIKGYVITQFYPIWNKLIISVCDFGVGIPTKINQFRYKNGKEILDDIEAIKIAIEKNFTTQSTSHNKGVGLNTVITATQSMKGVIKIISNNGFLWYDFGNNPKNRTLNIQEGFPGTLMIIELNTEYLDDIDVESDGILEY